MKNDKAFQKTEIQKSEEIFPVKIDELLNKINCKSHHDNIQVNMQNHDTKLLNTIIENVY